ncbi:hypothetical protein [Nodularia sp. UHCC 0506]|uniref:hypothetical protein n=1 Tax=Nodularia sp. UHCC 0506 TaxID=3110243 RepID=UPI002B1F9A61|nr:hypothetical protein [Nodularia sp. UHCC 0506]MEA5517294.1 hypothetical protein [Nodularia sp. UHCC 0506]
METSPGDSYGALRYRQHSQNSPRIPEQFHSACIGMTSQFIFIAGDNINKFPSRTSSGLVI